MRYRRPDKKNALSLLDSAEREMKFTLTLPINEESASTIIRNVYECFRMQGDALLLSRGVQSEDHYTPIKELSRLNIDTKRPLNILDNMRRLRHNINYYGYKPNVSEVKEVLSIVDSMFDLILTDLRKKIR